MPKKVKYKSKEYNKAYKNNQVANNYRVLLEKSFINDQIFSKIEKA